MAFLAAGVLTALLCLAPATARAYEDQVALSVDANYAYAQDGIPMHGAGVGVSAGIGLGDTFTLQFRGGYPAHPHNGDVSTAHLLSLTAEALYIVDILTWVPFFGAGIDGLLLVHDTTYASFEVHGIVGLDYLHSRSLAFGLDVRVGYVPFAMTRGGFSGLHVQAGLRVSWLFSRW